LSRGGVDVGVGLGGRYRMFSAFRVDPDDLVPRFTEGIEVMKALWTEASAQFDGRFWQLDGAAMEPKSFQKPHPPVWFGGSHPAALRRAARFGDGFFGAGSSTTAQFAEQVPIVREALEQSGRDSRDFPIAKRVYVAVDDDPTRATDRMAAALNRLYGYFGFKDLTAVAVHGPPEACVRGLRDVMEAGAELILLNPLFEEREQMERLAAEVVPALS
jgi:alkanesulfonate monooxygenase SsuD/methylene tetrahydromethanopterin reductase-like flavin-dependent oxidoreductase (luciferase family)